MNRKELDRIEKPKIKVRVCITFPNTKAYKQHDDDLKRITEKSGGTMAVKMV